MGDTRLISQCYEKSVELLKRASTPYGFVASAEFAHYHAIWGRDGCIAVLGACAAGEPELLEASRRTLETLATHASEHGQIPNTVWPEEDHWDWGETGCTDVSCWFIIALHHYVRVTRDKTTLQNLWPRALAAFQWLQHQDANGLGLIDSPEAGDWVDSTLNRSGKVLHVNVLYAAAARALAELGSRLDQPLSTRPDDIPWRINTLFWPEREADYAALLRGPAQDGGRTGKFPHAASLSAFQEAARPDRGYYLSHVTFGQFADVCDVLANLLAVLFHIADAQRARRVLDYLAAAKVAEPYPAKAFPGPITPENDRWSMLKPESLRHQAEQWKALPYRYHNAGVWPFIGGFYVLALHQAGRLQEAARTLETLAQANALGREHPWEFREWLAGDTGEPHGAASQTWNAATYILAQHAVEGDAVQL
ncbi:MAG: hypothetical protein HY685_01455 [Chloroflexi bacterium]|nr:hypothetical protein [Chloroflexota bacterium]